MKIVDTHTHIYLEDFNSDFDQMVQRAMDAGVERMLLPNIELSTWPALRKAVERYPSKLFPMIGLHPSSVKEGFEEQLSELKNLLNENLKEIVAIGETGIDLYWDVSTLDLQIQSFDQHIQWALEFGLPIVIHSRNAFEAIFKALEPYRARGLKGVFHCFTGTLKEAQWIVDFDFYLGIGGVLTYKKSELPEILPHLPKERIILETDAPYLSPIPYRGKRNEPAYMLHTLAKLAEVWKTTVSDAAEITYANSKKLFPKAWK
ncbi:TatD family hydrolase [Thermaurantimonas aggregans]|uniref:TatD family hydrolase n=1 Tax=Thermaurantimonas aggregans TaxID=2173829 RepID=A0A401XLS2_9FLAO|nr:TatD family hydrolase [Thermaurantimonas aggregans]MCX8147800.1 TatD family hydrolase [Thermaurantimonas aggregans]GCD77950.1 TatD family hydrolase [Thermaurantimonas aggregans]